ncbi:serine/threonine-protein kinase [Rubripirellula lacrimiformis]|uniref:serine/threonine-protein kinase n=1 Tax=Rubripirellula lacrimiformis TaxID=1930273 RepID=UPI0011A7EB33|nr:serine/threonine-protein kinase [Rubripirellula lacrimiformis]
MTNPFPHPDSEHDGERETVDENQAVGGDSGFSIAGEGPSQPASVSAELATHPRYEVLQAIGQGGMGSVYKSRHRLMDRLVAIKVIKPELIRNAKTVQRFQREVKAAARLSHPNIVTAFDAEQVGELHLLVMEHVDGIDLAELVKQRGPLSIPVACECIVQVAAGLQHAFENGMVHRDIKPQNLMLMSESKNHLRESPLKLPGITIKILDFGLASFAMPDDSGENAKAATHSITAIGTFMGTPDYVAPEQAQDARQADVRSDLYSLGATLHFLLYGRPPRAKKEAEELGVDQAKAASLKDAIDQQQVPGSLRDVIKRMMSPDPKDRFQTPSEVIEALTPFTTVDQDTLPTSKNDDTPATAQRSVWRRWVLGAVVLVCSVTVLLLFFGPWLFKSTKVGSWASKPTQHGTPPMPAAPKANQEYPHIDAIKKIDVVRDSIIGQWRIEADQLMTPDFKRGLRAVLELPLDVPAEYDLKLAVARRSDANERFGGLNIAFPIEDSRGMLAVGTHRDVGGCFIERIDGIAAHELLPTWTEGFFFEIDELRIVELRVRTHEIVVLIDGAEAIRWSGEPAQIEMPPGWEIPDRRSIFLGATGEFALEKIQFTPVLN